jgi:hypothetical protein
MILFVEKFEIGDELGDLLEIAGVYELHVVSLICLWG